MKYIITISIPIILCWTASLVVFCYYFFSELNEANCWIMDNSRCSTPDCVSEFGCQVNITWDYQDRIFSSEYLLEGEGVSNVCSLDNCCNDQIQNHTTLVCDVTKTGATLLEVTTIHLADRQEAATEWVLLISGILIGLFTVLIGCFGYHIYKRIQ